MDILREMLEDWPGRFLLLLMVILVAMFPLAIYTTHEEKRAWEAFAEAHDCKIVGRMGGSTGTGIGVGTTSSGQVGVVMLTSTSSSEKTGYACNDGVTYWR